MRRGINYRLLLTGCIMQNHIHRAWPTWALSLFALTLLASPTAAQDTTRFKLPRPGHLPFRPPDGWKVEPAPRDPRPRYKPAPGVTNLAFRRPVISSDKEPIIGSLEQITDGDIAPTDGAWVEVAPGLQWIQIDLGQPSDIRAIILWHYLTSPRIYQDVIIRTSDDVTFSTNVHTVFNSDHDNSAGFGIGQDLMYVEPSEGKQIETKDLKARYIRLYSNGNSENAENHYTEVEIYGTPLQPQTTQPTTQPSFVPIKLDLPRPPFGSWPGNTPKGVTLEPPRSTPRPPLLAPPGATNLALKKPVTSSDPEPIIGDLAQITDGDKRYTDGSWVELKPGLQWVQIDLGQPCHIWGILFWHEWSNPWRIYKAVIVQVADDERFTRNVRTLFNNDRDNLATLDPGRDFHYMETHEGKLLRAQGTTARYVRLYSRGNTFDDANHYTEVEVYGLPVKP